MIHFSAGRERSHIEADKVAEQPVEEKEQEDAEAIDSMSTPLEAMLVLREAMRDGDTAKLDQFLDRRYLP
jgi:hypothetical protein